ncbi:glycoside hydrolase family 2 protein [Virgisporangium ochraceum]|uniref:Beta-galactosidase n=1 Tax=Virgisporangium ochraceum TaxID=65505 RepID=A0A8J3ZPX3_9ACTN|nr:glycoside hydrolase family 2 TIM barrel-domain containing protein [Virgisporangium ochraceum]GIJ66105.1 beta-galactosidase [Virgisporangium ochraceum]
MPNRLRLHGALVVATCLVVLAAGLAAAAPSVLGQSPAGVWLPTGPTRKWVSLDAGWRFHFGDVPDAAQPKFDDGSWSQVDVPHTWNGKDGQDGGNNYERGAGWYRRHYTAPAGYAGRRVYLQFDGASLVTEVWVNGRHVGQHEGGFARFRFDVTDALKPGADNVISVRVDNSLNKNVAPLNGDFTVFGGLYRGVGLWVTDPLSIDPLDHAGPGVYLKQRALTDQSATVEVTTLVRNSSATTRQVAVRALVADATGAPVATASGDDVTVPAGGLARVVRTVEIPKPHRWNGRSDPYLYKASAEVIDADTGTVTDVVTEPLGLRTIALDAANGLILNGKRHPLHGVNRHQDRIDKGWAVSAADETADFDLMDEMGVNALRTAHYQQSQTVYTLADQRGYLVWTEIPLVEHITLGDAFTSNVEQQIREMIRQNYNHPSVVFWGIGNEQQVDDPPTNVVLDKLAKLVVEEDPTRWSAYAHAQVHINGGLDKHAVAAGYNRYFGWYYGNCDQLGPFLDNVRTTHPNRPVGLSEYGAGASVNQHDAGITPPAAGGTWHPEEYQSFFHERYWAQIAARPYLWGTFVWNMFDFAADMRAEGDTAGRNDKGLVTYDRKVRKDAFYFYKAVWTDAPFAHITSKRWTNRTAGPTTVKVYSTLPDVTLTINGVSAGQATTVTPGVYTWPVTLTAGKNTVEVSGTRGGQAYTDTVSWDAA